MPPRRPKLKKDLALHRAIGEKLREVRRKHNLTQAELAKKLCMTQGLLSSIENTEREISVRQWLDFCDMFDVDPHPTRKKNSKRESSAIFRDTSKSLENNA